ncbi:unnamed protein product [Prorocentrum cordatum]|uniref:Uncharacterized protein n=1 Tax=Prorocentrum cordatum TaxID=2364126 RepID=A0ABN9Q4V1_9DINO|nr:unnamed protein product [Polarella glacialis]
MMAAVACVAAVVLALSFFICVRQRYMLHISRAANVKLFLDLSEAIQGELLAERHSDGVVFKRDYNYKTRNNSRNASKFGRSCSLGSVSIGSGSSPNNKQLGGLMNIFTPGSIHADGRKNAKEALDLRENMWRWVVDPEGTLSTTDDCLHSAVKVLVCLSLKSEAPKRPSQQKFGYLSQARSGSGLSLGTSGMHLPHISSSLGSDSSAEKSRSDREHCARVVSNTLLRLCKNAMLDAVDVRCCIVVDAGHVPGFVKSDAPVLQSGHNDHLIVADILPLMCDAADYCILVFDDGDSLSTIPQSRELSASRAVSSRDIGNTALNEVSRMSSAQGHGHTADLFLWHASSKKPFGPAVYLAGLAALTLKSDRQSYVQIGVDDDGDISLESLVPYSQRFEKNPATLQLNSEVDGVELHGGLLCLWALNVSHGSFGFVRDAAPVMAEMGHLRSNNWWSCLACRRRAGFTVSLSDDILQFFHSFRQQEPIDSHRQLARSSKRSTLAFASRFSNGASSMTTRLGTTARAQLLHSLKASLTRRAMISRYLRLYGRTKDNNCEWVSVASVCDTSSRFTIPSSHPVAFQLHSVAKDVDFLLDMGASAILDHIQRYMTLEDLADRIQGFLVAYLRRVNGFGDKDLAHRDQLAAFELYTAAAEGHRGGPCRRCQRFPLQQSRNARLPEGHEGLVDPAG